jgi:hypothetical protein
VLVDVAASPVPLVTAPPVEPVCEPVVELPVDDEESPLVAPPDPESTAD